MKPWPDLSRARTLLGATAIFTLCLGPVTGCGGRQAPASTVVVGQAAPALTGTDQNGNTVSLADLHGKAVVVYFYPKDDTPGCTKEACAFRDAWSRLESAGIQVVGVSADDAASHKRFEEKYQLPFPLIADTKLEWANAFGVATTAGMTHRVTFLLDRAGVVQKVYPEVDPAIHAEQVIADVQALVGT